MTKYIFLWIDMLLLHENPTLPTIFSKQKIDQFWKFVHFRFSLIRFEDIGRLKSPFDRINTFFYQISKIKNIIKWKFDQFGKFDNFCFKSTKLKKWTAKIYFSLNWYPTLPKFFSYQISTKLSNLAIFIISTKLKKIGLLT